MPTKYRFLNEKKAHLHQINTNGEWQPLIGTSTASKMAGGDKGALIWWGAEMAGVALLEMGVEKSETIRAEYELVKGIADVKEKKKAMDALQKKYPAFKVARFAHYEAKNDAADKGVDLHAELEKYVKHCLETSDGIPQVHSDNERVKNFAEWAVKNVDKFLFSEGHCYSERLFLGGIADCAAKLKTGELVIIDFKSAKSPYYEHYCQIALYAIQISENGVFDADGNKVMEPFKASVYIVIPFGAQDFKVVPRYDVEEFRKSGEAAVALYKHSQQFEIR